MSPIYLRASVQNKVFRLTCVLMIAVFLVGAAATRPVGRAMAAPAATCTSTGDGDWSNMAIWDCGHVPTSADDVIIDNTTTTGVMITSAQSVHNLTINPYGILVFAAPVTLTIGGNFTVDAIGLFDPGDGSEPGDTGGTVIFDAGSQTITTNGEWVDFWNLTKIASGAGETLSVGAGSEGIHILNNLTLKGTSPNYLFLRSTSPGTQWEINPEETRDVDWVDVQDSNNVADTAISVAHGVDSGNNTGWAFTSMTSVALTSSGTPSILGQPVTFVATVTPSAAITGTVAFADGGITITGCAAQPVTVTGGVASASCTTSALALGSHSITAAYSGDETYSGSTSTLFDQVVKRFSDVTLTPSMNPSLLGTPVTFIASLSPITATGTVAFMDGGATISGCDDRPIALGTASCTTSMLTLGSHSISAVYSGDAIFAGSTAHAVTQNVQQATSVSLTSSANPSVVQTSITFMAAITPTTATGTMAFWDGSAPISGCDAQPATGGVATCAISTLSIGTHNVTAVYNGDATHTYSTSNLVTQVVDPVVIFLPLASRNY